MEESKYIVTITLAVITAVIAFVVERIKNWIDYRLKRKNLLIAIYVETKALKRAIQGIIFDEKEFKKLVKDSTYRGILVVNEYSKIVNRVKPEEYNLPIQVNSALVRFKIALNALLQCLRTINSEEFYQSDVKNKHSLIELVNVLKDKALRNSSELIEKLEINLPNKWFKQLD